MPRHLSRAPDGKTRAPQLALDTFSSVEGGAGEAAAGGVAGERAPLPRFVSATSVDEYSERRLSGGGGGGGASAEEVFLPPPPTASSGAGGASGAGTAGGAHAVPNPAGPEDGAGATALPVNPKEALLDAAAAAEMAAMQISETAPAAASADPDAIVPAEDQPQPVAPMRRKMSKSSVELLGGAGPVAPPRRKRGQRNTTLLDIDPEIANIDMRRKRSKTPTEEEVRVQLRRAALPPTYTAASPPGPRHSCHGRAPLASALALRAHICGRAPATQSHTKSPL